MDRMRGGKLKNGLRTIRWSERARWNSAFAIPQTRLAAGAIVVCLAVAAGWAIADQGWHLFVRRILDGLNNGFVYAAMAFSLVLIFKATGIINFAQGNMAMFGAFIAFELVNLAGLPVWLAVAAAVLFSAAAAAAIERVCIRPFGPDNHLGIIIVTLSWYLILFGTAGVIWGFDAKAFPSMFPGGVEDYFEVAGIRVRFETLGVWIVVLAVLGGCMALLRFTRLGLAFRAVSSNLESSRLHGIHIGSVIQFGWALAAGVGTLAACLIAPHAYLDPNMMNRVLIYSFAAQTVGGLDSLGGALMGGLLIGLVETLLGGYVPAIGPEFAFPVAFVVIAVILLVRPSGMFGTRRVERV
jgi:branched-chain amino acid transport system permease protein